MQAHATSAGEEPRRWRTQARENLADVAHSRILDLILSRQIQAGETLQERRLADWLDISRTPVREALNRLEIEGVVRRRGKALIVHEITMREMMEVFAVREQLETFAASLAADRVQHTDIAAIEDKVRSLMQTDPAPAVHWGVDDDLHALIAEAGGNRVLARYIADLRLRTRMFDLERLPERFVPGCEEHLAILEALNGGDADAAVAAMRTHIRNARHAVLDTLARY